MAFSFLFQDFGDSIPGHGGITDRMDCQVSCIKMLDSVLVRIKGNAQCNARRKGRKKRKGGGKRNTRLLFLYCAISV